MERMQRRYTEHKSSCWRVTTFPEYMRDDGIDGLQQTLDYTWSEFLTNLHKGGTGVKPVSYTHLTLPTILLV
eukprot:672609-Pleurochrysis_carterae.AAC.1